MYFCIIRDNGFIKDFIFKFYEYIVIYEDKYVHSDYDHIYELSLYEISDRSLRRMKLRSLVDMKFRDDLIRLMIIFEDRRFVIKFSEKPVTYFYSRYGSFTYSYGNYYTTIQTSYKRRKMVNKDCKKKMNNNLSYRSRFDGGRVVKGIDFHSNSYKGRKVVSSR